MTAGLPAQRLDPARGLAPTQRTVDVQHRVLRELPFTAGRTVVVPAAGAGVFRVRHNLGRVPKGVVVLDLVLPSGSTGDASVYRRTGDLEDVDDLEMYASAAFDSLKVWVW